MVVEQIQTNRFCPFIAYKVVFLLFVFFKGKEKAAAVSESALLATGCGSLMVLASEKKSILNV